ncbi:glycosyltransferase family 2 protein [bacterium]|nr:glycosyltransferase family 2 protein [bacterium]
MNTKPPRWKTGVATEIPLSAEAKRWLADRTQSQHSAEGPSEGSNPTPELSVVIPAYNEEHRLPPTLIDLLSTLESSSPHPLTSSFEIIVVDDGSRDHTAEVARAFGAVCPQIRTLQLPKNMGKGHAVRAGALNSNGKLVLFADADGSTPMAELSRLKNAIEEGADIAIGSRALPSEETTVETRWYRKAIGRTFNFLVNTFLLPEVSDTQCGFKLFTRSAAMELFRRQQSDGFSFDLEILLLARKLGMEVREVSVNWANVPGSKVNLVTDSAKMFLDIFRFAWRHRNVRPG